MIITSFPTRKARFVDTPSPDPFWRQLHRLADAAYPDLHNALDLVLTQAGLNISLDVLAQYLASGSPSLAITALEEAWRIGGAPALAHVFEAQIPPLITAATQATQGTAGLAVGFAVTDPAILVAVEAYGAERVTAIAETTREGIRAATSTAFQTHQNVGQLARTIRELVGLTPRQAESVVRYHAGLLEAGMPASRVETLVARQTQRLIRRRAEVIARHETLSAANTGARLLWQLAQEQGLVSADLKRYWVVTPDDRLCPICAAIPGLNPDGVGIDASFQTPVGAVLFPPAHILCRCSHVLTDIPPEVSS
jgi:hypothetical protein